MKSVPTIQTSELLSSLYLIQRQIDVSHNAYFKFYLRKKDGCIGNSVVCMVPTPLSRRSNSTSGPRGLSMIAFTVAWMIGMFDPCLKSTIIEC